jgi:putative dimethyl sulfoxide reductase chaperone
LIGWSINNEKGKVKKKTNGNIRGAFRRIFLTLDDDEKQALLEVVEQMSQFFWGPILERCQKMVQVPFWCPLEKVLPWLGSPSVEVFKEIKTGLNNFSTGRGLFDYLEEEYIHLFISDRQGIRAPLYASCYATVNADEKAPLMGEPALAMQDRFRSKGLSLADDVGEPPDHLSVELEYLYFLLEKGWSENGEVLLDEASSFGSEIMLPWVRQLQQRLAAIETENRFYPNLTTLLGAILKFIGGLNRRS